MAADCSFFLSLTAFTTVCALYCSADGGRLHILSRVNGCHDSLHAVLFHGWQLIAHSLARHRLFQLSARHIAQRMAAHSCYFRSLMAFTTVCAPYCSADRSGLLILPLVKGFHGFCAVFHNEWQRIAHSSARQWLSRRFACRFPQWMAVHCSFFRLSKAFIVCAPYCSADDSALLILPLVNGFHDDFRAVLLSGRQWIAHSSAHQRLSRRFSRRIAQWMAVDFLYFRSSTAFTVWAPFCSADDSTLLILPFVNGFRGLRTVFPNRWQWIARSSAGQRLSRQFTCHIALWMVVGSSYFHSSKAFTMVCVPYFCADVSRLLILLLVYGFHGLRPVLLSEWLRIVHCCARQWLSRLLAHPFPQWMVVHCWYLHWSTAFTVGAPFSSADNSAFLVLPLVHGFHGWRALYC